MKYYNNVINVYGFSLQKFCVEEMPIKQERLDEEPCGGMQKVPSLSDLSDPESSLGE